MTHTDVLDMDERPMKRKRGEKLPGALRDVLMREAYALAIKHYTYESIAQALYKSHREAGLLSIETISNLIESQRKVMRKVMDDAVIQDHLVGYLSENDAVQKDAWKRLAQTRANAQNVPGLQANILTAAKNKAQALGLLDTSIKLSGEVTLRRYVGIDPDDV